MFLGFGLDALRDPYLLLIPGSIMLATIGGAATAGRGSMYFCNWCSQFFKKICIVVSKGASNKSKRSISWHSLFMLLSQQLFQLKSCKQCFLGGSSIDKLYCKFTWHSFQYIRNGLKVKEISKTSGIFRHQFYLCYF